MDVPKKIDKRKSFSGSGVVEATGTGKSRRRLLFSKREERAFLGLERGEKIERGRGRVDRGKRPKESDLSEPPVARGSVDQAENLETEIERGRGRVSRGKRPAESDSSEPPLTCFSTS
ncbi:predicted protein [Arabidopsis lyrata subsp. lyrata]|uniref:Predicted protein n=1 Tax=Arabidopsis lyrata subsp. lyrata TaxID=81972 RepID=D7MHV5_ARALL|nr:predicted protein [Arabidopsis lyrata subsp. lyrata]